MRIAELFDLPKQAKREREIRDREIQKTWAPARQAIFDSYGEYTGTSYD